MVNETFFNATDIIEGINHGLVDSVSPLVSIFKVVGIALLVYVIFLIIQALFKWRAASKIVKISKNVERIDGKLDILIGKIDNLSLTNKKEENVKKRKKK